MQVKTKAIVLSATKYQDKNLIVKCFTQSHGIKTYFVRNVFGVKKSSQKIAYFQPLTILEIEATHSTKNTLNYFKEIKLAYPFYTLNTDITKTSILLFLSEIISNAIKEEETNEDLFVFIETALQWLDVHHSVSNFHLVFMIQMTKFLGFYPQLPKQENMFFEMIEGKFHQALNISCLNKEQSSLFHKLILSTFEDNNCITNVKQRQVLFTILLHYYKLHLDGFKNPKSLEILQELFI